MIPAIRLRYSAHQLVQLRCFAAAVFEVVLLVGLNRAKWERGAAREGGKHAKWERPVLHEGEKKAMWESQGMAKRRKARFGGNNRPKWERFLRVGLANMSNIAGSSSHFGQKGHCCQRIGASGRLDCACLGVENSQHRGLLRSGGEQ